MNMGRMSDVKPKAVILTNKKTDIISFLLQNKHIYSNPEIHQQIITYTRNKCLLRRTYTTRCRENIYDKLKINSSLFKQNQALIVKGFRDITISHLMFWLSYC